MWRCKRRVVGVEDFASETRSRLSKLTNRLENARVLSPPMGMYGYLMAVELEAINIKKLRQDIDALAKHMGLEFTDKPSARVLVETEKQEG